MRTEVLMLMFDQEVAEVVIVVGQDADGNRERDAPRGPVKRGELPWEAAGRVYEEQVGAEAKDWVRFAIVDRPHVRLHCFYSVGRGRIRRPTESWAVPEVLKTGLLPPDLKWLVPMAAAMASGLDDCEGYIIGEDETVEVGNA